MRAADEDVQLADRGAAEPVDHERHPVAGDERQVVRRGGEQVVHDLVCAGQRPALTAGLPVDPDPELHLVVPELEQRGGDPSAGGVHAVSATPIVRVTELTFFPIRTISSRSSPRSLAAPTALMTKKLPATFDQRATSPGGRGRVAPEARPGEGVRRQGGACSALRHSHIAGRRRHFLPPPLAKRVAGRADLGEARAGWGVLPRDASSTIRRGCRWLPWPNRRVVLVALSPRPATPHPYPSPPLGFAERGEGGARSRHV